MLGSTDESGADRGGGGVEPLDAGIAARGDDEASDDRLTVAPKRVALPAEPYDRVKVFGGLVLCLAVCAIPLMVGLYDADVTDDAEAEALLRSRETWRLVASGHENAWVIPSLNRERAVDPPPMTAWLHLASWWGLDAETADARELTLRARSASVAMAMLALLATYWAGMSIGGIKVGRLATLALGTTLLFVYYARWATPHAVLAGFTTFAIASGFWAMRPMKDVNRVGRRVFGWLLAGAALAGGILTAGPPALLFVLPPLIAAIALTPMRRASSTVGLVFAVVLGLLGAAPWYLYVMDEVPGAQDALIASLLVSDELFVITWSHFKLVLLYCPWIVWLIGALCQPFMRAADRMRRRQLLIAWFWFVLLSVAMSVPAAHNPRYLLPLMPAVALMVGQLWAYHAALASQRQLDPGVNLLRLPHWITLALVSVVGPALVAMQPQLIERGYLEAIDLPGFDWRLATGWGGVLLGITLLGARWHFKWRPRLAFYATTAWMIVAIAVTLYSFAGSDKMTYAHRDDATLLARTTLGQPLRLLTAGTRDESLDERFVFYLGRHADPIAAADLAEAAPAFVIARDDADASAALEAAGYESAQAFRDSNSRTRRLYQRKP